MTCHLRIGQLLVLVLAFVCPGAVFGDSLVALVGGSRHRFTDTRSDRDISRTRDIYMVIQGGQILDRDALEFDPDTDPGFAVGVADD